MRTETVEITKIRPYWRNPRIHTKVLEELKKSISRYGYKVPLVVDDGYNIITGHARYTALKELGYTEIMVIVADDLDEEKAKEFRLADNKLSELSDWDMEALEYEMRDISELENLVGFTQDEVERLLTDVRTSVSEFNVTEAQLERAETKKEGFAKERIEAFNEDLIEIHCPYCDKRWNAKKESIILGEFR